MTLRGHAGDIRGKNRYGQVTLRGWTGGIRWDRNVILEGEDR